jgi:trehalose-6-phosphatase
MEHLFKAWADFTGALKEAPHILLLADYDGTLAQIVSRPEDAVLSKEIRDSLTMLVKKRAYSVGIISHDA